MTEEVKRPNSWRKLMMMMMIIKKLLSIKWNSEIVFDGTPEKKKV
jgi:hypothetical protein